MAKSEEHSSDHAVEVLKAVGNRIREARSRAGLTQKDLGAKAGHTQSYIYEVETGRTNVTLRTLANLADALGMEVRDFFLESRSAPLSVAGLERLLEVWGRIAALLADRQKQDAELLAELLAELRALADLRSGLERALTSKHSSGAGAASTGEKDG